MRLKSALITLVAVVVIGVASATWYIRWQVKSGLDEAITGLSPFVEITYGSITVMPDGKINIQNIEIRPRLVSDVLKAEAIEIETPGLWFLLTNSRKTRNGELPEHMQLTLRGLDFNLSGRMAEAFDQFVTMAARQAGAAAISNCGDVRQFDLKTHRRLGYQSFIFDITLGYTTGKRGGPMKVQNDLRIRDWGEFRTSMEFSDMPTQVQQAILKKPSMRSFDVVYRDLSFTQRLKRYCAQAAGVDEAAYIDNQVNQSDGAYQTSWGFVPGPGLREAYREFLTKPGEIRIQGSPPSDMDMQGMHLFGPQEVVEMMNLRVHVNKKAVTDLTAALPQTAEKKPAPAEADTATTTKTAAVSQRMEMPAPQYRHVPAPTLGSYVGKTVRITLNQGMVREGMLTQFSNNTAHVEWRYQGGTAIIAIPLARINRAEVFGE